MGQEMPTAKGPAKVIRPLPGWHGAAIHPRGKVSVYSRTKHTIYSLPYTSTMTVAHLKTALCQVMHMPESLQCRLYWAERLLEDGETLEILTSETLLRVEMEESGQTAASTELKQQFPKPQKANSVEIWPQLRTDLSELSVPDLELRVKRRKGMRRSAGSQL